jgi:ribosomal protein S18 acetylase RimI-like enzyme
MSEATVILRDIQPTDHALIFSSWRNALWFAEKRPDNEADKFYAMTSKSIRKLLDNKENHVKIACLQEDPDEIIGYAVLNKSHLHFVYVKVDYRKKGIGSLLTKGFETVTRPQTRIGKVLVEKKKLVIKEKEDVSTRVVEG